MLAASGPHACGQPVLEVPQPLRSPGNVRVDQLHLWQPLTLLRPPETQLGARTAIGVDVRQRSLVGQGRGYSVLVTRPLSDLTYDGLRVHYRPLADAVPHQTMCTVRAPTSRMTRRCQAFQDICVRLYSGRGGAAVRAAS